MSEISFKQHWFLWSTFQDASFSPHESPKFSRFENFIDLTNLTQIFQIWLYSFIIEIKVVRNIILNNIDILYQPSRMYRSPPRIAKIFQIRKIHRFDKSDTDISDLIIGVFIKKKVWNSKCFKLLWYLLINIWYF